MDKLLLKLGGLVARGGGLLACSGHHLRRHAAVFSARLVGGVLGVLAGLRQAGLDTGAVKAAKTLVSAQHQHQRKSQQGDADEVPPHTSPR
jgi:hypothetical protein